jgi:hypothetical protein
MVEYAQRTWMYTNTAIASTHPISHESTRELLCGRACVTRSFRVCQSGNFFPGRGAAAALREQVGCMHTLNRTLKECAWSKTCGFRT